MNKKTLYIVLGAVLVIAAFFVGGMVDLTPTDEVQIGRASCRERV